MSKNMTLKCSHQTANMCKSASRRIVPWMCSLAKHSAYGSSEQGILGTSAWHSTLACSLLHYYVEVDSVVSRSNCRIVQKIPSDSSDEYSDNSDDEWLPENNRDIRADDDGDADSQDDLGQDAEGGQHDLVKDVHMQSKRGRPSGTPPLVKHRAVTKLPREVRFGTGLAQELTQSGNSSRGGGGVIGPYLCSEPQQSPRLLSAPPLSLSESVEEEEEDNDEACPPQPHPHPHHPVPLIAPVPTHTHHHLINRAEMKCLSPESPEKQSCAAVAQLWCLQQPSNNESTGRGRRKRDGMDRNEGK
ncbi:hypothetical protein Q8A73_008363 [Channa argus]|nr:hypothetical protein Q8A73_008363 [Channa argus]